MSQTIYLEPNMVPASLRGSYAGKMFKACVCETMTIPMTAGLWDSGSRDTYTVVQFETGRTLEPMRNQAPWDWSRRDIEVKLEPGIAVIEHSISCGKDYGLTFYVHPDNATKLLPAPVELTEHETIVLNATRGYKSSYGGMDRYEMARRDHQYNAKTAFPTREQWETAKQALIGCGLLNKAGAITTKGRNALPSRY
jgi:hypothetical protein